MVAVQVDAKRRRAKPAGRGLAGEVSCVGGEGTRVHCSNLAAVGHNKPAVHMMIVGGLGIILAQIDSLAPSICGNARFVTV